MHIHDYTCIYYTVSVPLQVSNSVKHIQKHTVDKCSVESCLESCKLSLETFHILCPISFHCHLHHLLLLSFRLPQIHRFHPYPCSVTFAGVQYLHVKKKAPKRFPNFGFQGSDRHPCDTWPFSRRNASQHPGTTVTSHLAPVTRYAKRSCESPHDATRRVNGGRSALHRTVRSNQLWVM